MTPEIIIEYGFEIAFVLYLIYISENHLRGIKAELKEIKELLENAS